ncbi:MAG TPA: GNAT family N-acetyltransferase [Thermoplasmata archaeon]|nr:GNAT family N-acetyltransferase [Thermoplasmata archaeon]
MNETETRPPPLPDQREMLLEERELVHTLGGFSLQFAGGTLVTNERIPIPRFNFVSQVAVARERTAAFFERALDHYFQRALRPAFHLDGHTPPHLLETLARFGFRARTQPRSLLVWTGPRPELGDTELETRPADPDELDRALAFWSDLREQAELRRALEVAWTHPNPGERVLPILALADGQPVSAALLHRYGNVWGIYGVATEVEARGRGAASALVLWAVTSGIPSTEERKIIWSDHRRITARLVRLGFRTVVEHKVFELDPSAELHLPGTDEPSPGPRWRPPRGNPSLEARKVA